MYSLSALQPIQSTLAPACMSLAGRSEPKVNLSSVVGPPPVNDIVALLDPEKSIHKICDLAINFSMNEKCSLL